MRQYLDLVNLVLGSGEERQDRTGTGTLSVFGAQTRYDLRDGFPIVTTKKVLFSSVVRELLWMLRGNTNVRAGLTEHTPIWDAWADESGDLGPVYGAQWRDWQPGGYDQITEAIQKIKTDPSSRRNIVSAWNVSDIPAMALPPCHTLFQFFVSTDGGLDLHLYQRSADIALGVPFNIASYALLLSMIAQECDLFPRYFIHSFGDLHAYKNHVSGLWAQTTRAPLPLPQLRLAKRKVLDMRFGDIELIGYQHRPFIRFEVSV